MGLRQGPRQWRLALLLACVSLASADEVPTRAYRGLWGGLFQQQAARPAAGGGLREALAGLQAKLAARLEGADASLAAHRASLEERFRTQLNLTLALLDGGGGGTAAASLLARLEQLHGQLLRDWSSADAQQLAALALVQGWALGAVVAGRGAAASALAGGAGGGGGQPGMLSLQRAAEPVAEPAWASFRPHTCLRLQNFGNAEGYSAAVLGAGPCAATPGAPQPAHAAASGEALRWGSRASFLLDCSPGDGSESGGGGGDDGGGGGGALGGLLQAAGAAAATSVAAALDPATTCRAAVGSDGGAAALLERGFERPLLGAPRLDALHVRICNKAPSSLQYPAALSRGPAIRLSGLKLNGRPLLPGALLASQAAAADGCLARLYRLSGRAMHGGYVLSGWVQLGEKPGGGSGCSGGGGGGGGTAGFGVGEMASLEVSLGQYSQLEAAASRLLGGAAQQAGGAP